jgi:hypothetical protein
MNIIGCLENQGKQMKKQQRKRAKLEFEDGVENRGGFRH